MREHFPFQAAQSAIVDMLHDYLAEKEHSERLENENARLKAEVERLRKAGDITSQRLHWFCQKWGWKDEDLKTLTPEWNAAKEVKQP